MGVLDDYLYGDNSTAGGGTGGKGGLLSKYLAKKKGPDVSAVPTGLMNVGPATPDTYKKGGIVKKTGLAKVHKGEKVLTKKQAKRSR